MLLVAGCQRQCNRLNKNIQSSERYYKVYLYSGGKIVYADSLKTIINSEENSDGIYFYNKAGELIEISGDYVVISKKL